MLLLTLGALFFPGGPASACGGRDVALAEDPFAEAAEISRSRGKDYPFDEDGNLLLDESRVRISPEKAVAIAEHFAAGIGPSPPLPLTFRKLEWVHRRLIYQFETEPVTDFNGVYHLGPVNFTVDRMVIDVDAMTGDVYLANGCGAAPGSLLASFNPGDFSDPLPEGTVSLVANNTKFIALRSENPVQVDGVIDQEEWEGAGQRYFYLGEYSPHERSDLHERPFYFAEVRSRIHDDRIYFAVKTDTPTWLALMFKSDPNLGMLGAYRDAKLLRSSGVVDDRHFTRRSDKTFFLAEDERNDILAAAARQDEFYTYELAYPLRTNDPQDVSFEEGKAYNMILAVGNTLDHYGIFTLDEAHANHDHSQNNKEHVNVWASRETTLRIGSAARRDIRGNAVEPLAAGVSGFDPRKADLHFHYLEAGLTDFSGRPFVTPIMALVAGLMGILGTLLILWRLRSVRTLRDEEELPRGFDLLRLPLARKFVTWKHFRTVFILPTLAIFATVILFGVFDIQDGRKNISTVYTWNVWWSLIIFSFILLGRFWCMMCPFAAAGDLAQKVLSLRRKLPRHLQNMGVQILGFILLTVAFTLMVFPDRPLLTVGIILLILAGAVVFSIVYEKRSFCRHLCPIGAIIGLYSTLSPVKLARTSQTCCEKHGEKTCAAACPMLESPQEDADTVYCNFCMKCVPACPYGNLTLRLRGFGSDLFRRAGRTPSEALAALLLLGVVIIETLSMTSLWEPLKSLVAEGTGIQSEAVVYLLIFTGVIGLPAALFYGLCRLLKGWLRSEAYRVRDLATAFALAFIPLGVSLHLAHNLQHMLIEGSIVVPATMRLVQMAGLGGSAFVNFNTGPFLGLAPIYFLQMLVILAGLALTLFVLYRLLRRWRAPLPDLYKMATAMSIFVLTVALPGIYLLGVPMAGRHVH